MNINEVFEVKLYMDWSSIEIFINDGQYVMTQQLFPNKPYNKLVLKNENSVQEINNFYVEKMKSIWESD